MKKSIVWVVVAVVFCIAGMGFIHWKAVQTVQGKVSGLKTLAERQGALDSLSVALEKYRVVSSDFRKLDPSTVAATKEKLRNTFKSVVARLESEEAGVPANAGARKLVDQVNDLLEQSARIEPMLFSQDAYNKPEIREIHAAIESEIGGIKKAITTQLATSSQASADNATGSARALLAVGGLIAILVLSVLIKTYLTHVKPLTQLHQYARNLRDAGTTLKGAPKFGGFFGEIQAILNEFSARLEAHAAERHKFVQDVVTDLRMPLSMLQAGKSVMSDSSASEAEQVRGAQSLRQGLAVLSGSLDDLNDLMDIGRLERKLDEKVVDLSELVTDAARTLSGAQFANAIQVDVPSIPIWMSLDTRRLERVLILALTKLRAAQKAESSLQITVSEQGQGKQPGVEILIREMGAQQGRPAHASGPEVDVLKHWLAEKGVSMALAQRIIRAHGGTMTAAGVAGTSATVAIRLPQTRVISRGLISPPSGLTVEHASNGAKPEGDIQVIRMD